MLPMPPEHGEEDRGLQSCVRQDGCENRAQRIGNLRHLAGDDDHAADGSHSAAMVAMSGKAS